VSRATLSLDNSHEGLAFTFVVDQVVDCCICLGSRGFQLLEAKALASSEVSKGTIERHLATRYDRFTGSFVSSLQIKTIPWCFGEESVRLPTKIPVPIQVYKGPLSLYD
jgi:hypothetical protein